ncbi:hypothetical protein ZEAMMB73_Zm00001d027918 [Zea mays]|uniref:Uncharacterized protein n=1 Tax=Zea mays TaxID=4577 RepID=A0A1D6JQL9_MAIZE|nr:hypothetical protein ZEAMMB73_Zm00001d027918 [Zea mays]
MRHPRRVPRGGPRPPPLRRLQWLVVMWRLCCCNCQVDETDRCESHVKATTNKIDGMFISMMTHENFVDMLGDRIKRNLRIVSYEFATMGSLHDVLHGMILHILCILLHNSTVN